jgi:hypothetical protein
MTVKPINLRQDGASASPSAAGASFGKPSFKDINP